MSRLVASYLEDREDREGGQVVITRPSATALLCIDSDDRYANYGQRRTSPTYPFSFPIVKNEAILNGFFKRLALTEFRMNWCLPNIANAWENNQMLFKWKISGTQQTDITINLRDGFYDSLSIASAIQTQIRDASSSLALFSVSTYTTANNELVFYAPNGSNITFILQPVQQGLQNRQLYDMLNVPNMGTTYVNLVYTGIPDLRATDYIDIVCTQLTYNQKLKDTTSAPISRDMLARIYLDDPVPSSAVYSTNTFSSSTATSTPTALFGSLVGGNTAIFVVSTAPTSAVIGEQCSITGITGDLTWNGPAYIVEVQSTTSPYTIAVEYLEAPFTNSPTFSGSPLITYRSLSSVSTPQTEWDDKVNQITPFVLYRQFPYPKQVRWDKAMPIGNLQFDLYDDQGRSIQYLWTTTYGSPASLVGSTLQYTNSTNWNATLLVSED